MLLCSDGLTNMLPDPEIREIVSARRRHGRGVRRARGGRQRAGGRDNVSAILVRYTAERSRSRRPTRGSRAR